MYRTIREWMDLFTELGAFWLHDGNPQRPHALLTSGKHSNGFFNGSKILFEMPWLGREAVHDAVELVLPRLENLMPDIVIGPAFGAVNFVAFASERLRCEGGLAIPVIESPDGKRMLIEKRFSLEGKRVLLVEDTVTTGSSVGATAIAVASAGGILVPTMLALCNRSGCDKTSIAGGTAVDLAIAALIDKDMPAWDPPDCPLCTLGSEAIRPKIPDTNWTRLTATY